MTDNYVDAAIKTVANNRIKSSDKSVSHFEFAREAITELLYWRSMDVYPGDGVTVYAYIGRLWGVVRFLTDKELWDECIAKGAKCWQYASPLPEEEGLLYMSNDLIQTKDENVCQGAQEATHAIMLAILSRDGEMKLSIKKGELEWGYKDRENNRVWGVGIDSYAEFLSIDL